MTKIAGRPRKPTAIKKLQGEKRKERLAVNEPRPDPTMPECPDWLRDEARAEWDRVCRALHECGILTSVDRAVLAGYCQAWARWKESEVLVAKSAQILKSAEGSIYINPALGASSMAMKQMLSYATQLGMSPVTRSKITVDRTAKEPTLAEMLFTQASKK